jgi:eukaryotic-like serine/threonine-protein kinase
MKTGEIFQFGNFKVDVIGRTLRRREEIVTLNRRAFDVLLYLVQNPGRVLTRDELLKNVWPDTFVDENSLAQSVSALRRALEEKPGDNSFIVTLPGRGYQFVSSVKVIAPADLPIAPDVARVAGDRPAGMVVQRETIRTSITAQQKQLPSPRRSWARVLVGALCLVVLGGGVAYVIRIRPAHRLTAKDTIVLAEFDNQTGDPVFDETLRLGLSAQLEQSPFLNLLSDRRVAQTLSLMTQPGDARLTGELAVEVCRRTASAAVLNGTIAEIGTQYLLTLKAIDCTTGETVASTEAQANDKNHVLGALGNAASEIRTKLGESLASVQKYDAAPEDVTTPSLEALQAYSLGYHTMIAKNDRPGAIPLFQRAINLDSNFAMAYARLGITFYNLDETARAEENLRRAYDLRDRLSQREKLYVAASYEAMVRGNMEEARKAYEMWQQIYPRDQFAVGNLGVVYGYLGYYEKQLAALQEAWKLNPGNALVFSNIVGAYLSLGRIAEAKGFAAQANDKHLDSLDLHDNLYLVDFVQHDIAGMEREASELVGKAGWEDLMFHYESDTAAFDGHFLQARALTRRAVDSAIRADKSEPAADYEAELAVREALAGNAVEAERDAKSALARSQSREVEAIGAIALALAGDSQAGHLADDLNQRFPENTAVQFNFLPVIHAAQALRAGHAERARELLTSAQAYEFGQTGATVYFYLYPCYMRGEADLAERQGEAAAAEFQKILDHLGLVANELIGALAHLGLGRAYALAGDKNKAKSSYEDFFVLWKDGDRDVPILKQAKAEYAKLQ